MYKHKKLFLLLNFVLNFNSTNINDKISDFSNVTDYEVSIINPNEEPHEEPHEEKQTSFENLKFSEEKIDIKIDETEENQLEELKQLEELSKSEEKKDLSPIDSLTSKFIKIKNKLVENKNPICQSIELSTHYKCEDNYPINNEINGDENSSKKESNSDYENQLEEDEINEYAEIQEMEVSNIDNDIPKNRLEFQESEILLNPQNESIINDSIVDTFLKDSEFVNNHKKSEDISEKQNEYVQNESMINNNILLEEGKHIFQFNKKSENIDEEKKEKNQISENNKQEIIFLSKNENENFYENTTIIEMNSSLLNASDVLNRSSFNMDPKTIKFLKKVVPHGSYGNNKTNDLKKKLNKQKKPLNEQDRSLNKNNNQFFMVKTFLNNEPKISQDCNPLENLNNTKNNIIEWVNFLYEPGTLKVKNETNEKFRIILDIVKFSNINYYDNINIPEFLISLAFELNKIIKEKQQEKLQLIVIYESHINKNLSFNSEEFNNLLEVLNDSNIFFLLSNVVFDNSITQEDFENFVDLNQVSPILKMTINQKALEYLQDKFIPYMIFRDNLQKLEEEEKTIKFTSTEINFAIFNKDNVQDLNLNRDVFLLDEQKFCLLNLEIDLNSKEDNRNLLNIISELKNLTTNNWLSKINNLSIKGHMLHDSKVLNGSSPTGFYCILKEISPYLEIENSLIIDGIYNFFNKELLLDNNTLLETAIVEKIKELLLKGVKSVEFKNTKFNTDNILDIINFGKETSLKEIYFSDFINNNKEQLNIISKIQITNKNGENIRIYTKEKSHEDIKILTEKNNNLYEYYR